MLSIGTRLIGTTKKQAEKIEIVGVGLQSYRVRRLGDGRVGHLRRAIVERHYAVSRRTRR